MNVEVWVEESLRYAGNKGATLREIQRFIDEHHYEELAVDTLQKSLDKLMEQGRVANEVDIYKLAKKDDAKSAFDSLFSD